MEHEIVMAERRESGSDDLILCTYCSGTKEMDQGCTTSTGFSCSVNHYCGHFESFFIIIVIIMLCSNRMHAGVHVWVCGDRYS